MTRLFLAALLLSAAPVPNPAMAATETFTITAANARIGTLKADTDGDRVAIAYDVKQNGRGPTIAETLRLASDGRPAQWRVTGTTTFGSAVNEAFDATPRGAAWTDSTGEGSAPTPGLYVSQSASPYALGIYARALMRAPGMAMAALPGGRLSLQRGETMVLQGAPGPLTATLFTLTGIDSEPDYMLLDDQGALVAVLSPASSFVRAGYEGEDRRLRDLATALNSSRLAGLQRELAHNYNAPVRIVNVRVFDPAAKALTGPVSVVVNGRAIASVQPADAPASPGEVRIDGAGGTLVPGMFEMHGHLGANAALPNLIAGVTTVRDMGNNNAVLDGLVARIERGEVAGPRVIRSGFIEGKSPFSARNGILAASEAEAVDAVRWYAARGYWQIKSYNSIDPKWIPAMVAEAHRLGLRFSGHVPAFATADQMIAAGYDEMTHINQFVLGWVIKPTEDTRTLFRLTALKRLQDFDLDSAPARATMDAMVARKLAIDPTLGIHEWLFYSRDGQVPPGSVDYIDHLPIAQQRDLKSAKIALTEPGDGPAYAAAFAKMMEVVRRLNARSVLVLPGTDTGGALTYHRELELLVQAGMTPAQALARATLDMARYTGRDQSLGSIERGKLADFFLVPGDPTRDIRAIKRIAMVVKDGVFYYPAEAYPKLGIRPFADAPKVTPATPAAMAAAPTQGDGEAHGYDDLR